MLRTVSVGCALGMIAFSAFVLHAYGEDISVQGTELIGDAIRRLDSAVIYIDAQDKAQAIASVEQADQFWHTFVDHHAFVYKNEVTPSTEIHDLIAAISRKIESLLQKGEEMVEAREAGAVQETIAALSELREFCAIPVLLDFTGAACKSCKVMKTRLQSVAENVTGTARVVIIDVNDQKEYSKKFKIMLIPTLVFITREGEEAARHIGEMEVQAITGQIVEMSE